MKFVLILFLSSYSLLGTAGTTCKIKPSYIARNLGWAPFQKWEEFSANNLEDCKTLAVSYLEKNFNVCDKWVLNKVKYKFIDESGEITKGRFKKSKLRPLPRC